MQDLDRYSDQEIRDAFRRLFSSTEDGKLVALYLSAKLGFHHRTTFVPGDPHQSAFNEGMRYANLVIADMFMNPSPDPTPEIEL